MSKRKAKPQSHKSNTLAQLEAFRLANKQIYDIRVSYPILRIVQALVVDQDFRDRTIKLMLDKKL